MPLLAGSLFCFIACKKNKTAEPVAIVPKDSIVINVPVLTYSRADTFSGDLHVHYMYWDNGNVYDGIMSPFLMVVDYASEDSVLFKSIEYIDRGPYGGRKGIYIGFKVVSSGEYRSPRINGQTFKLLNGHLYMNWSGSGVRLSNTGGADFDECSGHYDGQLLLH